MTKQRRKHVSGKFLRTYLFMGIVPVFLVGVIFLFTQYQSGKQALLEQTQHGIEQIASSFDRLIDNVESVSLHFSKEYEQRLFDSIPSVGKQFAIYKESFSLNGDFYFYRRGDQTMYGAEGPLPYHIFESLNDFGSELNMASFFSRLNTASSPAFLSSKGNNGESNYFLYLQPIPNLSVAPEGTLSFIMDSAAIKELITNAIGDFNGYFSVYDTDRRIIYTLDAYQQLAVKQLSAALSTVKGTNVVEKNIEGHSFQILRLMTDKRNFSYVLALPTKSFYAPLRHQITLYAMLLSGLLVMAACFAFLTGRHQFRPIRHLADTLDIHQDMISEESSDLFDSIGQRFSNILDENEELSLKINSYTQWARSKLIEDLLSGNIREHSQLEDALRSGNIIFDYPCFFVVVFRIMLSGKQLTMEEVRNHFGELDLPMGKGYAFCTNVPDRLGIVINASNGNNNDVRTQAAEVLNNKLSVIGIQTLGSGVSRMSDSILSIDQQLFEAYAALKNRTNEPVLFSGERTHHFPVQECELFRQNVLYANQQSANNTLDELLDNAEKQHWPLETRQALCFVITNILITISADNQFSIDEAALMSLASKAQINSFREAVKEKVAMICEKLELQKVHAQNEMNRRMIHYVCDNFCDPALTVDAVAIQFRTSPSAVRKIIKDVTGTSLSDYITILRFSYVKKQLAETEKPIKDIVEGAGYIDVSSFTRKFRMVEGITPGQYRAHFSKKN